MSRPGAHVFYDAYGSLRACDGPGDSRGACPTCQTQQRLTALREHDDSLLERVFWAVMLYVAVCAVLMAVLSTTGCVTRVTPCVSYDHGARRYEGRSFGASVCADVEPPAPSEN